MVKQKKTITGKQKKTSNLSTIPISNFQLTICEDVTFLDQKTKANNCCGLPTLLLDFWLQRLWSQSMDCHIRRWNGWHGTKPQPVERGYLDLILSLRNIYIYTYSPWKKVPLAPKSKREKLSSKHVSYLSWGWAWESPSQMFLQLGSLETKLFFLFWKSCCKLAGHLVHLATVVCAGVAGYHLCASWRWRNIATNLDQVQLAELVDWTKVDASNSWPHP